MSKSCVGTNAVFIRFVALSTLAFAMAVASTGRAEGARFHGSALGAHAISGHQMRELGFGASGLVAGELPLVPALGVQAELGALWLSEGKAPSDPSVEPGGDASAIHAAVGARFHPLGELGGPWLAAAGGVARTGGLTRPMFDVGAGYDFALPGRHFALGPSIGLIHVFQPDAEFRAADANIAVFGAHVVFDPGAKTPERRTAKATEPDKDPDKDGVLDPVDRCPLVPEDRDGFEDADGCPDPDNDRDQIVDARDKCPNQAEDRDGFEDSDGCPDPDNDKDGILDPQDLCPNEPETKNGYADEDGCPDSEQVRVIGDRIVLDDRVHFATNSSQIQAMSYPLLERVAKLIAENPTYVHVEVEGHADERGPDWFNTKLSQGRAESVLEFLVNHGIDRARLSAKGYGKQSPLVAKKTEHAWYMNRRVEFAITREESK